MEQSYWHQRWDEDRIGFHLAEVNDLLKQFWHKLAISSGCQVFVPLCGKSHDLMYLHQMGLQVIGIELNPKAIQAFFDENGLKPEITHLPQQDLTLWQAKDIKIYQGDFFHLEKTMLKDCQAVYDRAALVALPPQMRKRYVEHMQAILPEKIKILLISLEYDQNKKQGPPFSVSETQVTEYFQSFCDDITLLDVKGTPEAQKSAASKGVAISDKVYLLESL